MNNEYIITPKELMAALADQADLQLVDVRTLDKHQAYHIGGIHIPLEELSQRFHELDKSKPLVTYCTMGGRSMRALQLLMELGFTQVKSLDGGMTAWREMNG